jgi:hypothetical protein
MTEFFLGLITTIVLIVLWPTEKDIEGLINANRERDEENQEKS